MTDIREVLDRIQEDIENPWRGVRVRLLLAALRAALEVHWETCNCDEGPPPCRFVRKVAAALEGGAS